MKEMRRMEKRKRKSG